MDEEEEPQLEGHVLVPTERVPGEVQPEPPLDGVEGKQEPALRTPYPTPVSGTHGTDPKATVRLGRLRRTFRKLALSIFHSPEPMVPSYVPVD